VRFVVREKLAGGTAPEFLEFFGELASDAKVAVWHDVDARFERFREAIPGFKKKCRFGALGGYVQLTFALSAFDWEESSEEKFLARESRTNECGQDRRRSRNNREWQVASDAFANQSRAGIGKSWRSGVGDEGDVLTCRESLD
jgi:hypothetical protein